MTETRAVLYLRQSLDRTGDGLAIERQRQDCRKLARARGWKIVDEYVDNDVSASGRKPRPAYTQMLAGAEAATFDVIVCWAVDRLTRKLTDLEHLIELAERTGVTVASVSGDLDLSADSGRLVGRILASVARGEVERKSARQVRAARQRAERGEPALNGFRPFGYSDGEVVEHEAELVRGMYSRLLAGDTISGISRWMTSTRVPTSTGDSSWHRLTVRNILLNPRYAAISTYRGTEVGPGCWTPVVDEPTYRAAVALLADPKRKDNRVGNTRKWLGSGLYLCGECGKPMRTTGPTVEAVYICPGHLSRNRARVDELVTATIAARLRMPDVADLLADDESGRTEPLRREATALRIRLDQAADAFADGLMDAQQLHRASERIREQLADIEQQLADVGRAHGLGGVLAAPDPGDAFLTAPLGVQRSVVALLATVRLGRGTPGRPFEPESVKIEWRS